MKALFRLLASLALCSAISVQAASPTVRLATSDWPPYVGKNLREHGYNYAIVKRAFEKAGYKTIINFYPWSDTVNLAKFNNDAFFPQYENSALKNLACSEPMYGGPLGLYKRKDSPIKYTVPEPYANQEQALQKLKQYRFGIVEGYTNTAAFDAASYLKKIAVKTDFENLEQLANKKVDLVMIDVDTAGYLIANNRTKFGTIEFMGPALSNKKLYVCFSTLVLGYQKKLADFNRGLLAIEHSGETTKIRDRLDSL